jgi:hypothetical protein
LIQKFAKLPRKKSGKKRYGHTSYSIAVWKERNKEINNHMNQSLAEQHGGALGIGSGWRDGSVERAIASPSPHKY